MDKILEKFGVYDIVGVLLPGICIVTFSDLVLQFVYGIALNIPTQINGTVVFLIISYFCGLVFQEIGSGIVRITINKNNHLLKKALEPKDDTSTNLSWVERDGVFGYIKGKLNLTSDDYVVIYNYCKSYPLKENNTVRMDKDQSVSAMSRSLFLYFVFLALAALGGFFLHPEIVEKISFLFVISLAFAALLFYRMKRFAKIRYVNIIRTFYYNVVVKG